MDVTEALQNVDRRQRELVDRLNENARNIDALQTQRNEMSKEALMLNGEMRALKGLQATEKEHDSKDTVVAEKPVQA